MTACARTFALADLHRALGSELEDWNGRGTAWSYSTDPNDEHDAVREAAGMFDMWPLKKVYVRGPDAAASGTRLDVASDAIACTATVEAIPFFDPEKTRVRA